MLSKGMQKAAQHLSYRVRFTSPRTAQPSVRTYRYYNSSCFGASTPLMPKSSVSKTATQLAYEYAMAGCAIIPSVDFGGIGPISESISATVSIKFKISHPFRALRKPCHREY